MFIEHKIKEDTALSITRGQQKFMSKVIMTNNTVCICSKSTYGEKSTTILISKRKIHVITCVISLQHTFSPGWRLEHYHMHYHTLQQGTELHE